ncbi:MAG TPA: molecular chaperone DnaJ [Nitrolancea sp.]|nr:molecular chaperone DnaJ [Nitrolancea sp.]
MLPARIDELERVQLELEILRSIRMSTQVRQLLAEEETEQQGLRRRIDERLGSLRSEADRLKAELERMEARLERLSFVGRSLSDDELDKEEEKSRADEAAWWAEWRHRRTAQQELRGEVVNRSSDDNITLRQLYKALARLVHPDLAEDLRDRAQRETLMRMANAARDAGDVEQLRRLLAIWARADDGPRPREIEALRARVAQQRVEIGELRRQLAQSRLTSYGLLLRRGETEIRQYLRNEEVRLRRELATFRLRRRRVLRQLDERRRGLNVPGGQ